MFFVEWAYPVVYFFILLLSYFPVDLISDPFFIFGQLFSISEKFFLKLPFTLADLGVAYLIFRMLREDGKERYAMPLSLAYWLNPLSIFVSNVHGHFESISVFFAILGFYHLWKERYVLGGLELALSFGVKYQGVILFPAAILFMWGKWRNVLKFALSFIIFASLSLLPLGLFYYDPNFHVFFFAPSIERALTPLTKYATEVDPFTLMNANPNLSHYSFLIRLGLTWIPFVSLKLSVLVYGLIFCCLAYFAHFKGVFKLKYGGRRVLLAAYFSAAYMAAFLSMSKVNPHYVLWALPFLLLLYSDRSLDRVILLLFNFLPLCNYFLVNSIFYYINGGYWGYAGPSSLIPAIGLIFSVLCLAVLVNLLFEENVFPFKRQLLLMAEILPGNSFALSLLMVATLVIISLPLNANGILWSQYPILPAFQLEEFTYPLAFRIIILFLVVCILLPAFMLTIIKPILLKNRQYAKRLSLRVKIALLTIPLALASALASWIVKETISFVASGISHALMFTPSPSSLNPLCANGGTLVSVLLLISFFAALLMLLDNIDRHSEVES
ncbi:MAG: hypothetical protein QW461_01820 [Candidatus Jordarchaeales archaeon]